MPDTGTGTDPGTDRCADCGHLPDAECRCTCCNPDTEGDCPARARQGWLCTLDHDHTGDHIAHGPAAQEIYRWPREVPSGV